MRKIRYGYQLHIQLCATKPAVWRRLLVAETTTLAQLHQIIQAAMGWENRHLYMFEIAGQRYGIPDADWPDDPTMDARRYTIGQLLRHQALNIRYLYDFGDEWLHRIKMEACVPLGDSTQAHEHPLPQCLAGRNACPPEDCGGPIGFTELIQAPADDDPPPHASTFNPRHFDLHAAQQRVKALQPEQPEQPRRSSAKPRPVLLAA